MTPSATLAASPPASMQGAFGSRRMLIGEAPSTRSRELKPAFSQVSVSTTRLEGLLGGPVWEHFMCRNLIPQWRDDAHASGWPAREAAIAALDIAAYDEPWLLVLCGRRVQRAFRIDTADSIGWYEGPKHLSLVFPHPSGLNRFWNYPSKIRDASTALTLASSY